MSGGTSHIVHELPVPQSAQDLRAACGLPAVTVRHGDQVHQFAYTTQPEYVTCVGCLAVREVAMLRATNAQLERVLQRAGIYVKGEAGHHG